MNVADVDIIVTSGQTPAWIWVVLGFMAVGGILSAVGFVVEILTPDQKKVPASIPARKQEPKADMVICPQGHECNRFVTKCRICGSPVNVTV